MIVGGIGTDLIRGDDGDDTLRGQENQDTIYGGDGQDNIYGGDEEDTIYSSDDHKGDFVDAGDGKDLVYAGGIDVVYGGLGDDTIIVYAFDDGKAGGRFEGNIGADDVTVILYDDTYYTTDIVLRGGAREEDREGQYGGTRTPDDDLIVFKSGEGEGISPVRSISADGEQRVVAADADLVFDWDGYFDNGDRIRAVFDSKNFETNYLLKNDLDGTLIGDSSINLNTSVNNSPVASDLSFTIYETKGVSGNVFDHVTHESDAFSALADLSAYAFSEGGFVIDDEGNFSYTNAAGSIDWEGPGGGVYTESWTYYVTDGIEASSANVTINIKQNSAPVAEDATFIIDRPVLGEAKSRTINFSNLISDANDDQEIDVNEIGIRRVGEQSYTTYDTTEIPGQDRIISFDGGTFTRYEGGNLFAFQFQDTSVDYEIVYYATDSIVTDPGYVSIDFNADPDAPDATLEYPQDGALTIDLVGIASDIDGDDLTLTELVVPQGGGLDPYVLSLPNGNSNGYFDVDGRRGTFDISNDGIFSIQSNDLTSGLTITYTVSDGRSTATGAVTLNENLAPEATDGTIEIASGAESVNVDLAGSLATDPEDDDLTVASIQLLSLDGNSVERTFQPASSGGDPGSAFVDGIVAVFEDDGTVTFRNLDNDSGAGPTGFIEDRQFLYSVSDGLNTDTANFSLDVNEAPEVSDGTLRIAPGILSVNVDLTGSFVTDPEDDEVAITTITLLSRDGTSVERTFTPPVSGVPGTPYFDGIVASFESDGTVTFKNLDFVVGEEGTEQIGFTEDRQFLYSVSDGLNSKTASFTLDVSETPEASDATVRIAPGIESVNVDLAGSFVTDAENDDLTITSVNVLSPDGTSIERTFTPPGPGTISIPYTDGIVVIFQEDGTVTFENLDFIVGEEQTERIGFTQDRQFTYTVSDGFSSDAANFTLDVNATPDASDATAVVARGVESVEVDLAAFATDAEDDDLTITSVQLLSPDGTSVERTFTRPEPGTIYTQPIDGIVVVFNADGTVTFSNLDYILVDDQTERTGFTEDRQFRYTVSDGTSSDTANFTLDVNEAPVWEDGSFSVANDSGEVTRDLTTFASDPDGDPLTFALVDIDGTGGTVSLDPATGELAFDPGEDFLDLLSTETRTVTVTVSADDGYSPPVESEIVITVSGTNKPPSVPETSVFTTFEDTATVIDLLALVDDPDGTAAALISFAGAGLGTLVRDDNGTTYDRTDDRVVYTPDLDANGSDTFTFTVRDPDGAEATGTVEVDIIPVNDAPEITSPDAFAVTEFVGNSAAIGTVTANDVEDNALVFSISGGDDGDLFIIDPVTGALGFVSPPDFEAPQDSDGNNDYQVRVGVFDGLDTTVQDITVSVVDFSEIYGTPDAERLLGTDGPDLIDGLGGRDRYFGRGGADIFVMSDDAVTRVCDFELGVDKLDVSAWGTQSFDELVVRVADDGTRIIIRDTVSGDRGVIRDAAANLDLHEDSFIFAPVEDLVVEGSPLADKIAGRAGNDILDGDTGRDRYFGNGGADTFVLGTGDVTIVKDFQDGADILDVSGWGMEMSEFSELELIDRNGNVIVRFDGNRAVIQSAEPDFDASHFDITDFKFADTPI